MRKINKLIVFALGGGLLVNSVNAAEGLIGPVNLDFVSIVSSYTGHQPGNMEVGISGGFSLPAGVYCDSNYITTLKSAEAYQQMFDLLVAAHTEKRQVVLGISNDPEKNAYPGRCALTLVNMK